MIKKNSRCQPTTAFPSNFSTTRQRNPMLKASSEPMSGNLLPCDDVKVGSKYAETTYNDATTVSYHEFCTPETCGSLGGTYCSLEELPISKKGRQNKLLLSKNRASGLVVRAYMVKFLNISRWRFFRHSDLKPCKYLVNWVILLMEEILHHLECIKTCK